MSSWGKTDELNSAPKWLESDAGVMPSNDVDFAIFVDVTEAQVASNRADGIKTPGWNTYREYVNQNGVTRKIVEPLVTMKVAAVAAGDAGVTGSTITEDSIVADS